MVRNILNKDELATILFYLGYNSIHKDSIKKNQISSLRKMFSNSIPEKSNRRWIQQIMLNNVNNIPERNERLKNYISSKQLTFCGKI